MDGGRQAGTYAGRLISIGIEQAAGKQVGR